MREFSSYICLAFVIALLGGCASGNVSQSSDSGHGLGVNAGQFAEFAQQPEEGPVYMLNLLKFKERTTKGDMSGAESYAKYGALVAPMIESNGGKVINGWQPTHHLIGDPGQDWDMVAVVEYPSRQSFFNLVTDSDYQKISHYRGEGLERSVLIAMTPLQGLALLEDASE